jgi:GNAT superfamily N-acetyltransferase
MAAIPDYDRIDANFQLATGAIFANAKTGEVLETRDVYITCCGLPVVDYNMVFLKRPAHEVEASLDRGARYFEDQKLPYRVCARADRVGAARRVLAQRGLLECAPVPGMQLAPIPDAERAPGGLEIRRVEDAATLADFQRVAFEGFGLPIVAAPLFLTEQFQQLSDVALFMGYAGGEPACTSALVASAGVAGIYWVVTLERFRGRGYGETITWQAVRSGRELGCDVASLQASDMGRPVYERMGFVNDRDYARFDAPSG